MTKDPEGDSSSVGESEILKSWDKLRLAVDFGDRCPSERTDENERREEWDMREAARERVCRTRREWTLGYLDSCSDAGNGTRRIWRPRDEGGKRAERAGSVRDGGGVTLSSSLVMDSTTTGSFAIDAAYDAIHEYCWHTTP